MFLIVDPRDEMEPDGSTARMPAHGRTISEDMIIYLLRLLVGFEENYTPRRNCRWRWIVAKVVSIALAMSKSRRGVCVL